MPRVRRLISLLALLFSATCASAQPATQPADELRVYIITIGPGAQVWEKFGHNMIWIHDPLKRPGAVDAAYNWGVFDFDSHFMANFILYRMRYRLEAEHADMALEAYSEADRSVWIQELNLTLDQKETLLRNVEINREPEKKYYNYDYYRDNCSTRVRDAVDAVIGAATKQQLAPKTTNTSYRWHTLRLMADDPIAYVALDFILGPATDRKINQWEESFLPVKLMAHLRDVTTDHGPLILSERAVHLSKSFPERDAPPRTLLWFLLAGVLLGAAMSAFAVGGNLWTKALSIVVICSWCTLGLVGGVMIIITASSGHIPPKWNENFLLLNPMMGAMLVLIPRFRKWPRVAVYVALAVVALGVLDLLLQALPGLDQENGRMMALALPANVGLAAGVVSAANKLGAIPWLKRNNSSPST